MQQKQESTQEKKYNTVLNTQCVIQ